MAAARMATTIEATTIAAEAAAKARFANSDANLDTGISRRRDSSGGTCQQQGTQGGFREAFHDILLFPPIRLRSL